MSRTNKNQARNKQNLRISSSDDSSRKTDRLVELVQHKILNASTEDHQIDRFIYEVVGDYMAELMSQGFIPQPLMDILENDLKEETLEIYRKTTYGCVSLKEYKDKQIEKQNRKRQSDKLSDKLSKAK